MKDKNWHLANHRIDKTKELPVYRGKKLSIRLVVTRHFKPVKIHPIKAGLAGVSIMKVKRNRLQRLYFWFLRLRFKELTIKELKKLSASDQKKYLDEKYYLYGIVPYLKDNVTDPEEY